MKQEEKTASTGSVPYKNAREVEANARTRMDKVLLDLQHELSTVRTGRASIGLLDSVRVDYYGTPTPLNQVGQLHVPEPGMITVQPFDSSMIRAIEKAIRESDLGVNPSNDGKLIRIPIPPLTEERRRELAKKVSHIAEERRVAMRNVRRDANDQLKKLSKEKLISEDDERQALDAMQKLTDGNIGKIDATTKAKEKEILEFK